jgi:hypothetical protein
MMIPLVVAIAVIALYLSLKRWNERNEALVDTRPRPSPIAAKVICGNCAGTQGAPRWTQQMPDGSCETCGAKGASVLPAGPLIQAWLELREQARRQAGARDVVVFPGGMKARGYRSRYS